MSGRARVYHVTVLKCKKYQHNLFAQYFKKSVVFIFGKRIVTLIPQQSRSGTTERIDIMANQTVTAFFGTEKAIALLGTDYSKTRKLVTENVENWLAQHGGNDFDSLVAGENQKGIFRFLEAVNFASSKNDKALETQGARATYIIAAIIIASKQAEMTFGDVRYVISAVGNSNTAAIKGIQASTVRAIIGSVPPESIKSMLSRSTGKNGLFTRLGITEKTSADSFTVRNASHPFLELLAQHMRALTSDRVSRIIGKVAA
jgi:hypothetical protein